MNKVAVVSGKGGTGKTTFAAMLHAIEGCVVADCDVDAPNLHILLQPEVIEKEDFVAGEKAFIGESCNACGICYELCRFEAIVPGERYRVDERRCEGCALCYYACPQKAVEMRKVKNGEIYVSKTAYGFMVHARLLPGEENSGRLASEVRRRAEELAKRNGYEFVIVDSAPGVGCPVMASLTGVDAAVVITEPTASGFADMLRLIQLLDHFRIKPFVVVNRYDLNKEVTIKIEEWCRGNGVEFGGKIPYDEELVRQMSELRFPFSGRAAEMIAECWKNIKEVLRCSA